MKHDYPSISVSQFFEDMINEGNITAEASPMTASDPSMPDLREVPEVDINDLFGTPKQKKVVTEAKAPQKDPKQEMLELMSEFKQVVQKANKLFSEMTTVGMLGVNMAGPAKKPKKTKPSKLIPSEHPLDDLGDRGRNLLGKQLPPKKLKRKIR